jgi:hypothetical protein
MWALIRGAGIGFWFLRSAPPGIATPARRQPCCLFSALTSHCLPGAAPSQREAVFSRPSMYRVELRVTMVSSHLGTVGSADRVRRVNEASRQNTLGMIAAIEHMTALPRKVEKGGHLAVAGTEGGGEPQKHG